MLWTDPKMKFYGRTMVKIKMIVTVIYSFLGNYPKRNKLHLQHGESLKRRMIVTVWRIAIQLGVMTASLINNKL